MIPLPAMTQNLQQLLKERFRFSYKRSLFAWYSLRVKYDLFNSKTRGQTTFSQTICRFSVEEACLPFVLIHCLPLLAIFFFRGRDSGELSNLRVRLNLRFYNLIIPWRQTITLSGMRLIFFSRNWKIDPRLYDFQIGKYRHAVSDTSVNVGGSLSIYQPCKIVGCMCSGNASGQTATIVKGAAG